MLQWYFEDGGKLKLSDNATSISYLHIDPNVNSSILEISQNQSSVCSGDQITNNSSTILLVITEL